MNLAFASSRRGEMRDPRSGTADFARRVKIGIDVSQILLAAALSIRIQYIASIRILQETT